MEMACFFLSFLVESLGDTFYLSIYLSFICFHAFSLSSKHLPVFPRDPSLELIKNPCYSSKMFVFCCLNAGLTPQTLQVI